MKILIAEDDPIARHLLETYLRDWGHDVVVTKDGAQAWARAGGTRTSMMRSGSR